MVRHSVHNSNIMVRHSVFYFIKQLCAVVQDSIFKYFFVTNSDHLQFFRREFINRYKLHNYKLLTIIFCWFNSKVSACLTSHHRNVSIKPQTYFINAHTSGS